MLLTPFIAFGRQFREVASNSTAFLGSLLGSTLLSGGVAALVMFAPTFEVAAGDDLELTLDFIPGELVRLGPQRDPEQLPDKRVVPPARAPDDAASHPPITSEQVTPPTPPKPPGEAPAAPPAKPLDGPPSDRPPATPHPEPPTADELPGDPFGSADGWSELHKASDPWATEVMRALDDMRVGTFAAEAQDVALYKFRLEVCPDGALSAQLKQSTGDPVLDARIKNAIDALQVDLPAHVLALLAGKCQKIKYEFTWRGKGTGRGIVQ
ncbi:hypothetical protein OV203_42805 [Nannocystis sp. ILAH1]|uniref:hypothetical protein n=1 Tax=Nannocystis sp. ILAH1 TaxID=2996789 RepID=UPI002271D85D|nr:hypothetical protein [Nannocystis sp. ILAH1]MCY0993946.1 hypothetical protein [Nannocystis sp. ILAH1]